ncbi:MAG: DUF547 domain-containing protein [Cyclobacteriaceae bacterium]
MKTLFTFLFLGLVMPYLNAQSFFQDADDFFAKYVSEGRVDYAELNKNPADLNALVKQVAELNLNNKRVTADYMKAFYINAYNILVIKQVVDRYPIFGPLRVEGFFDGISHNVMGKELTLNQLEKETLYKRFPDPRLHFVLVCAAKGCPPIAPFAYTPSGLNEALDDRTRHVLNLEGFIRVQKKRVQLSQIFNWYKGDFGGTSDSEIAFINNYRNKEIDSKMALDYYEYDWSLNE